MPNLLLDLDAENEASSILERNGLTNTEDQDTPIQELKKSLQESTSDLPLNKALHLLIHVHAHVFDKAVTSITKASSPAELMIKKTESPTVRALVSIDNYLDQPNNTFQHIYDPLKDKFLKRVPSEPAMRLVGYFVLHSGSHYQQAQQYLIKQLTMQDDKRGQLAAVVLLQFLFNQYIAPSSNSQVCHVLLDALVALVANRSSSPTLLPCSACTLALQMLHHITMHPENGSTIETEIYTKKIQEITDNQTTQHLILDQYIQKNMSTLLDVLEKWHTPKDELITIIYAQLRQYKVQYDAILFKYLTPATVLSPKPLSTKRQIQLLSSSSPSSMTLILWTLLEKGQFTNTQRALVSVEEEQILQKVYDIFETISSQYIDEVWMPRLVMSMPQLSTRINSVQLVEAILGYCSVNDLSWVVSMIMHLQNKESCICRLIWYILSDDTRAKFAYSTLSELIQQRSEQVILLLQDNLLPVTKQSNQACELLIKCMPYLRLPVLLQKLMKMVVNADDIVKEKLPYIPLISKVLLQEPWTSDGILLYIDRIREFKALKGFVNTTQPLPLTPRDITHVEMLVEKQLEEQELAIKSTWLIGSIQLWATKVETNYFVSGLRQLVRYSYGLPQDTTCIDVWRHLSFVFAKDHALVWPVIEECLAIMQAQARFTGELVHTASSLQKDMLFLSLSPMLILQTIPKEAFDVVQLPKSFIDLIHMKLQFISIEPNQLKINSHTNHTQTSIQLLQALLQRCLDQETQIPIDFTTALLTKIFCK